MQVFMAGATGALGRALVPLLVQRGHSVRVLVRSPEKAQRLMELGVDLVQGDLLAPETKLSLPSLVSGCQVVIHAATSIPGDFGAPGAWDANTRLRTEGTRSLLDAALAASAAEYIQQSIVMAYVDGGDRWLDEQTPLDTSPGRTNVCGPVIAMEGMVRLVPAERLKWCILRGGLFVGPGTGQANAIQRLREGKEVVACDGSNYVSPVNVQDMASAIAAALDCAPAGSTFNIVDEPVRQGDYLDRLATLAGAPLPPRDPSRPCPPSCRCSNTAAREVLRWEPTHGIWPA